MRSLACIQSPHWMHVSPVQFARLFHCKRSGQCVERWGVLLRLSAPPLDRESRRSTPIKWRIGKVRRRISRVKTKQQTCFDDKETRRHLKTLCNFKIIYSCPLALLSPRCRDIFSKKMDPNVANRLNISYPNDLNDSRQENQRQTTPRRIIAR